MRLPLRPVIGFSAAFATMAVVLGSAILAPADPSPKMASTCPSKMKHSVHTPEPSGA